MSDKTYTDGLRDGIQKFGTFCKNHGDCSSCKISEHLNDDMDCAEFAGHFPQQFLAIIESSDSNYSYYNEFCKRFSNSGLSIEELADSACRKAIFEGYVDCEREDCVACWNEHYTGDVTVPDIAQSSDDDIVSLFGDDQPTPDTALIGNNIDNKFTNFDFLDK